MGQGSPGCPIAHVASTLCGEKKNAVVLALLVPLIICSGGTSGPQAATFVVGALTIGEIGLRD